MSNQLSLVMMWNEMQIEKKGIERTKGCDLVAMAVAIVKIVKFTWFL